ncbi:decarboxylase [bacterium]|nr:decarboxylase [bacterium]
METATGLADSFSAESIGIVPSRSVLPREKLISFVNHFFDRGEIYRDVVNTYGSPLYVLESSVLRARAEQFRTAFESELPRVSCYFAVKSNNHPDVARILTETGFGLDVSSGLELNMALSQGNTDIIFSGPGKTLPELELAVENAEKVIVLLDSFSELSRIGDIARSRGKTIRAGVRLNFNPTGLWRKFGIKANELSQFLEASQAWPNVSLQGIQFHSSWNLTPATQIKTIQELGQLLRTMPETFTEKIEFIDIGGGFWPEVGEWLQPVETREGTERETEGKKIELNSSPSCFPADSIKTFAQLLGKTIREQIFPTRTCRICCEPGRWICNDAMQLLITALDKKAPDLVVTDAGTNAIGWERFETDYIPILNLTRPELSEHPCYILGSLCTPHDVWGYAYWGSGIQTGDLLLVPTQGAYTFSLRQNFIKPIPPVVTI